MNAPGPLMRQLYGLHLVDAQPVALVRGMLLAPAAPMRLVIDPRCTARHSQATEHAPALDLVHVVRFNAAKGANVHAPVLVLRETLRLVILDT